MANKKRKRLFFILGGLILLLIIIALIKGGGGDRIHRVTAEDVKKRTIIETVSASGKIQPEVEVKISSDVSGEIVEINVKEGEEVKKGDLIVKIRPDVYISAKERAEAALNTARANLANSKARLAQVKAQFINAKATFERQNKLFDQGAISEAEYDNAKSSYEMAKADVEAAEQSVVASKFNVESAKASLKEAEDNLAKTTIYAPVSGTISKLDVEVGERVVGTLQMAGTEMLRIADLTNMEVNVDVNENDIVRVEKGDTVIIEVDAYLERKFRGIVTEIANSANVEGMNVDQVTNFEVKIRILRSSYKDLLKKLPDNLSPFRPGMSATVDIRTEKRKNALSIPIQAVTTRVDTAASTEAADQEELMECVFTIEENKAKRQKVVTGIQDTKFIEIKEGLSFDHKVITGPYTIVSEKLEDGDPVEIVSKEEVFSNPD